MTPTMTTKLDLHLHTRGSDGTGSAQDIVRAAQRAGLDGFAITDHHRTHTAEGLKVAELAREKGLLVFRGCEYSTDSGHLLVFGIDVAELGLGRYPEIQKTIDAVNRAGGVAIPAHPYRGSMRHTLGDKLLTLRGLAAVEGLNGQVLDRYPKDNERAQQVAKEKRWKVTGGSDAHSPYNVGKCFTVFERRITTEHEFIRALRHGRFAAEAAPARALDSERASRQSRSHERTDDFWNDTAAKASKDTGKRRRSSSTLDLIDLDWDGPTYRRGGDF